MSRTLLYNTADEAIAAYIDECERHCQMPYKVVERLDWDDWLEANPPPSNKYVINWVDTLRYNFDGDSDGEWAVVWKPCWSQKWEYAAIDINLMNSLTDDFHERTEAILIQVCEDDRDSDDDDDTESTATAPDAEEAPTEPLPRD